MLTLLCYRQASSHPNTSILPPKAASSLPGSFRSYRPTWTVAYLDSMSSQIESVLLSLFDTRLRSCSSPHPTPRKTGRLFHLYMGQVVLPLLDGCTEHV